MRPANPDKLSSPTLTFTLLTPDSLRTSRAELSVQALDGHQGPWTTSWALGHLGVESVEAERWSHGPGRYRMTSRIGAQRLQADFTVSEQDHSIAVTITWVERTGEGGRQWTLLPVRVEHMRPSDETVTLLRCWTPSAGGKPRYLLVNHRKSPIFGMPMGGNFFGALSRWSGTWEPFSRGGSCGNVAPAAPVKFGDFVASTEGYFLEGPRPLSPGRYRYGVSYALEPEAGIIPPDGFRVGETVVAEYVHYELSDSFEIPNP